MKLVKLFFPQGKLKRNYAFVSRKYSQLSYTLILLTHTQLHMQYNYFLNFVGVIICLSDSHENSLLTILIGLFNMSNVAYTTWRLKSTTSEVVCK